MSHSDIRQGNKLSLNILLKLISQLLQLSFYTFEAKYAITFVFPVRLNKRYERLKSFLIKHPTHKHTL